MTTVASRLALSFVLVLALVAVAPSAASAQLSRTWVNQDLSVGDDGNPCTRTAPCRSFAGAISKTVAGGEINILGPGGYGGVTITKSLTISGRGGTAGVLVSGTNAIVVNAGSDDRVRLRGLDINGVGTGLNAIRVLRAKSVRIENVEVHDFVRNGIDFEPSNPGARLVVRNTTVEGNTGNGILVAPSILGASVGSARVVIRSSEIDDNGCGVTAASFGPLSTFDYTQNCGVQLSGTARSASVTSFGTSYSGNAGTGVSSVGPNAVNRIGGNDVFGNAIGLNAIAGGSILSYGSNHVDGNDVDGNPTGRAGSS